MGAWENKSQISQEVWKHSLNTENFMCKVKFCEIWHEHNLRYQLPARLLI